MDLNRIEGSHNLNSAVQKLPKTISYENLCQINRIKIDPGGGDKNYYTAFYTQLKENKMYDEAFRNYNCQRAPVDAVVDRNYKGLHRGSIRFGPGVATENSGYQDVGWWNDHQIVRLCQMVLPEWIPIVGLEDRSEFLKNDKYVENESWNNLYRALKAMNVDESVLKCLDILYNKVKSEKTSKTDEESAPGVRLSAGEKLNHDEKWIFKALLDLMGNLEKPIPQELLQLNNYEISLGFFFNQFIINQALISRTDDYNYLYNTYKSTDLFMDIMKYTFLSATDDNNIKVLASKLLSKDRDSFADPGQYESACIYFLACCSEGNVLDAYSVYRAFDLNPNLCDGNGNSGVFYACSRDRVEIIQMLAGFGTCLNTLNDDGLSPLLICLLRYIAIKYRVKNWRYAFTVEPVNNKTNENRSQITLEAVENYCKLHFKDKNLSGVDFSILQRNATNLRWLFRNLNLSKAPCHEFQPPYVTAKDKPGNFLLDIRDINSSQLQVQKLKKKDLTMKAKLTIIYNTIRILLYYGADPNLGTNFIPSVFLILLIDNPDLLEVFYVAGADPGTVLKEGNLTVLHYAAANICNESMLYLCQIMLNYTVDPNARTDQTHWIDQKQFILASYAEEVIDEGKTALHIVVLRDYSDKEVNEYLYRLIKLLVSKGANIDAHYLGHTPLSLAILKGNMELIKVLLDNGANPNEVMGEYMGNPLTIYFLKRYADILPPIDVCRQVLDLLIENHANPLLPVAGFENTLEFLVADQLLQPDGSVLKEKFTKLKGETRAEQLKLYLLTLTRKVVYQHCQKITLLTIIVNVIQPQDDPMFITSIMKFLNPDDALRIFPALLHKRFLKLSLKDHCSVIRSVFSCIIQYGARQDLRKKVPCYNPYLYLKALSNYKSKPIPILDPDFDIYKVCFHCGFREDKILLACPKCGLIYFCSEECNRNNNKLNGAHRCSLLFYKMELENYRNAILIKGKYMNRNECRFKQIQNLINLILSGCTLKMKEKPSGAELKK